VLHNIKITQRLCIGDSCARGCKTEVHDDIFRQNFVVGNFVEPGAYIGTVTATADSDVILSDKKGYINFLGRFQLCWQKLFSKLFQPIS